MAPRSRSGSRPGRALAALAALILIMLISITGSQTFHPGSWHRQFKVGLGLDLSSGTEVVLRAATAHGAAPSSGAMQASIGVLLARVNGTGNSGAQIQQQGSDQLTVTVPGQAGSNVIAEVSTTAKLSFRPVLYEVPYTGATTTAPAVTPSTSPSPSGTASPAASSSASARPSASASGSVSSGAPASTTVSPKASTAAVAERLASPSATASPTAKASASPRASGTVKASATPSPTASASAAPTGYGDVSKVSAANLKLIDKMVCVPGPNADTVNPSWKNAVGYTADLHQWDTPGAQIVSCDSTGTKYVLGPSVVEGTQVTSVATALDQTNSQWVVNINLNSAASQAFGTLTTQQYDTYYAQAQAAAGGYSNASALDETAIVLDGNVQEAPQTQGALTTGSFTISGPSTTGGFTQAQATQLTNILKYGSLPITFTLATVSSISPQLGHASLSAGLLAGAIGLFLVVLYLFYYYRGLGLVSVSSLALAALLAYLSVVILSRYQNFTMSLSAIAGLVVAIGITADSFIVYFERLRDEVRDGKALRPAVEAGWKRARRTILVSDTVSFLAAVLLYHFAVSDVQGFAYTLGLTTIIDVVVVFLFTKPMVTLLAGTKFFGGGHKWSGLDPMRLGAKAPWRSGARRTVRTQRTGSARPASRTGSSTPSQEA